CQQLQAVLGEFVVFPEQVAYNLSLSTYWSQQEQTLTPSCFVSPQNTQDISKVIEVLSQYQESANSIEAGCKFAIRGAGHTPWAGSANIDGGVTIDMTSIDAVNVNPAETIVSVGAGARWSAVYQILDPLGLGVVGGRIADVGVGGLILGGGLSYFAPRYGFVCDQVVNYEIVLADGTAVNANATANPDLWFALKGGSSNFGVVTRFDLNVFPQGKFWAGSIYSPIDTLPAQIQAFADLNDASNYDTDAAMINTYAYSGQISAWIVANLLVYTKRKVNPRIGVLQQFTGIKPQLANTMRLTNFSDLTSEELKNAPSGRRQTFSNASGLVYSLVYQPLPGVITSHGTANASSPNAFGLDPEDGPQVLALQCIQWAHTADDALINAAARTIFAQADELAFKMGMQRRWIYLNYASDDQDPIGSYGPENVAKLQAASKKYDPTGLFQINMPGGFKLFKEVAKSSTAMV
ncbi:MAG: hypothetical protein Q9169_001030, partial [Polycauliona sp. 2 TL-2023]